jgi:hypothetical protein
MSYDEYCSYYHIRNSRSYCNVYISDKLKQSAVRSSALLSLIVALFSFFPEILNAYLSKKYRFYIGTSFMEWFLQSSRSYFRLAVAGILFSSVYINKSHFFQGFEERRDFSFYFFTHNYGRFDFILRSTKIKGNFKDSKFF